MQTICEKLNSARLPFEPVAVTVMLSQASTLSKVATKGL